MATLVVRVQPGARRTAFVGWYGELPRLAVSAPPVDGAANAAATAAIAAALGVRPNRVRLVHGRSSRTKRFEVVGFTDGELERRVRGMIGESPG